MGHNPYAQCAIDATMASMAQQRSDAITSMLQSTGSDTYTVTLSPGGAAQEVPVTPGDIETNNMSDGTKRQLDWASIIQAAVHEVDARNGWTLEAAVQIVAGYLPSTAAPSSLGSDLEGMLSQAMQRGRVVIARPSLVAQRPGGRPLRKVTRTRCLP